jgi:hypothetical protein
MSLKNRRFFNFKPTGFIIIYVQAAVRMEGQLFRKEVA